MTYWKNCWLAVCSLLLMPTSALSSAPAWATSVNIIENANADEAKTDTKSAPVTLDHTRLWQMQNAQGQDYRIMISLPDGEPPDRGYRVLYVLDANAYFPSFHAARATLEDYRDTVIVGIGYPKPQPLNFLRRSYDFSPPAPESRNEPPQGGQDEFLAFIEERLMPRVADKLPIDVQQQSLFGHSFGGMFAIYALFNRPDLFAHVVAVSPTLWWDNHYLLPLEPDFVAAMEKRPANPPSLALIVGERDTLQEIQEARSLAKRLEPLSAMGMRTSFTLIPDANHSTVPFLIVPRVFRDIFEAGYTP